MILNFLLSSFVVSMTWSQSVNLSLDHWAYSFLERMEAKGIVRRLRDGSRPFSREKIAGIVRNIDDYVKVQPDALTRVEKDLLERLKGELWDELKDMGVQIQEREREPHFYSWQGDPGIIHFDVLGGGGVTMRDAGADKTDRRIYSSFYGGNLRGLVWAVGFYSDNRIFTEWGSRKYVQHYRASQGYPQNAERDSSRATWDTSDSYFCFGWRGFRFQLGRENLQWGPSYSGGLLFSGLAPSFDLMKVSADIGAATFTWTHGELRSDYIHKWISAHRLEISLARGFDIGVSESVIYGKRGIEIAYLNPFIPYLVAEHTLGDKDNVALGLDFDVNRVRNFKLYGEFFIDDLFAPWEIFSDFWGNKLAFMVGGYWVDPIGLKNSGLRWEYTRIEPYVYTHQDSVNIYEHYDVGLGHFLQPNSDGLFLRGEYRFSLALMMELNFCLTLHGCGDRRIPHQEEEGEEKRFLSGVVERKNRLGVQVEWEIWRDVRIRAEAARVWVGNWQNVRGDDREWNEIVMRVSANW